MTSGSRLSSTRMTSRPFGSEYFSNCKLAARPASAAAACAGTATASKQQEQDSDGTVHMRTPRDREASLGKRAVVCPPPAPADTWLTRPRYGGDAAGHAAPDPQRRRTAALCTTPGAAGDRRGGPGAPCRRLRAGHRCRGAGLPRRPVPGGRGRGHASAWSTTTGSRSATCSARCCSPPAKSGEGKAQTAARGCRH